MQLSMWSDALPTMISSMWRAASTPARDIETINLELILSDMEILDRRIDKAKKIEQSRQEIRGGMQLLERVRETLDAGRPARSVTCTDEEREILSSIALLTNKPVIYAANLDEDSFRNGLEQNPYLSVVTEIAKTEHAGVLPICAELERKSQGWKKGGKGALPVRYRPCRVWA